MGVPVFQCLVGLALVALFALVRKHHLATRQRAIPYRLVEIGAPHGKE